MRLIVTCVALAAGVGCVVPENDSGTSVGNPNKTVIKVAPGGMDLGLNTARLKFSSVQVSNSMDSQDVDVPESTDVLAGAGIDLPSGDWTQLTVVIDGTFDVTGTDGDGLVDLKLRLDEVSVGSLRSPLEVDEPHVFELAFPGWLEAQNAGWVQGDDHVIREGDATHDVLVDFITDRSAYLPDPDGDGVPDR